MKFTSRGTVRFFLRAAPPKLAGVALAVGLVLPLLPSAGAWAQAAPVDSETMVSAHNQVRAQYGQSPLAWSQEMVAVAESWARQLEANPRWCQALIHNHERPQRTGENMHAAMVSSPAEASDTAGIVGAWAAEQQHYDVGSGACAPGQVCGHFVQVVWGETTELGCAAALCQEDGGLKRVTICNYRPGLLLGQRPF